MQEVTIDLRGVRGASGILTAFGNTLYFGGASQSHWVSEKRKEGWGFNWAAMTDCLALLPEGGLWGTAPKYKFPLHLILLHNGLLRKGPKKDMMEILDDTQALYAKNSMSFTYELVLDESSLKGRPFKYLLERLKRLFTRSIDDTPRLSNT